MTAWYVRPDTSHSATRNGTSYATAWGGWSAIVWGGTGVVAGDTLYVCGAHSASAQLGIGPHGATVSSPVIIRGDYKGDPGSVAFTGSSFLLVNRNYTTIKNLAMTGGSLYCLYFYGAAVTGITVQHCTLRGGAGQPMLNMSGANGLSYVDITITDNDFIGGSGSPVGSAISWFAPAPGTPLTSLTRINITNNRFTSCSSARAVVELWIQDGANPASNMADIIIAGNTFTDCYGVAMEAFGPQVYGRNTGISLLDNIIRNQKSVGIMGGAMAICGFGPSLTDGFGSNVIARNKAYGLQGPTGMVNVFYGTYRIFDNIGEDITTNTIDGSGILFDHGCDSCVAYGNKFSRLKGVPGVYYSGNGITILDATNIEAYGNIIEDAHCSIHFGNKAAGQSSNIHNNTFTRCFMAVDMVATSDKAANRVRNNIFTANGAVPSVRVAGGTWAGESGNCFYGFGDASGHKLHATSNTADPQLDGHYRPGSSALLRKGTYLGGMDFNGKQFYNPPNIGAVDDVTATPRYLVTEP